MEIKLEIEMSEIAEAVDTTELAREVTEYIDMQDLAGCIDMQDLAGFIRVQDISEYIDMQDLAGNVFALMTIADKLDAEEIAESISNDYKDRIIVLERKMANMADTLIKIMDALKQYTEKDERLV